MIERIRPLFAWIVFPGVMGGAVALSIAAMQGGLSPIAAAAIGQGVGAAVVVLCERIFPYIRDWNRTRGDVRTDALHAMVSGILTPELAKPFVHTAAAGAAVWLSGTVGGDLWPREWPLACQLALALVVGEFGQYWFHRWEHEREILWRFHATHHSAPRLYWLNAGRFHPFDLLALFIAWYGPLVAFGCGPEVLALFAVVNAVHGIFQHSNLELRLGPLNWIFSMAELHRWHHSRTVTEANRNYGANLIVWDVVFGTRFLPADRLPPTEIGIADMPNFPGGWLAQLASPFRWRTVRRESR